MTMNNIESEWHGYKCLEFEFDNRKAKLVCPRVACEGNKWLFKTEYFGAFPAFELEMLAKGFHVAYVENGKVLYEYYLQHGGDITKIVKIGCDHHPHGLEDNTPLVEFVNRVY